MSSSPPAAAPTVQAYDGIAQAIATIVGQTHDLSFWLDGAVGRRKGTSRYGQAAIT